MGEHTTTPPHGRTRPQVDRNSRAFTKVKLFSISLAVGQDNAFSAYLYGNLSISAVQYSYTLFVPSSVECLNDDHLQVV